jgi:hypothetical protein
VAVRLQFEKLPSLGRGYLRAVVFGRRPGLPPGQTIPRIEATVAALPADPARVAAYRTVCGVAGGPDLPLTYPMVLAAPLHLAILTASAMPVRAMGIIHVRNVIVQHRTMPASAAVSIRAFVEGHRDVKDGVEIDLVTEVDDPSGRAWESVTTVFARMRGRRELPRPPREGPEEPAQAARDETWQVPADMGRRYAAVSGDYNPVHLHAIPAKLLGGFPRALVHGMWTLARCVGAIGDAAPAAPVRLECEFRKPVLLPSTSTFAFGPEGSGGDSLRFAVKSSDSGKVQVTGLMSAER